MVVYHSVVNINNSIVVAKRVEIKSSRILLVMDAFLSNLLCMLLPVIYIIVISCVRATDVVTDSKSRRLMNEVNHVIDVSAVVDSGLSSGNACSVVYCANSTHFTARVKFTGRHGKCILTI